MSFFTMTWVAKAAVGGETKVASKAERAGQPAAKAGKEFVVWTAQMTVFGEFATEAEARDLMSRLPGSWLSVN